MGSVLRHVLKTTHVVLGTPLPHLGRATAEERLLGFGYRLFWPIGNVRRLRQQQHLRRSRFDPATGAPLDVLPGLLLLGRRRAKWQVLRQYRQRDAVR